MVTDYYHIPQKTTRAVQYPQADQKPEIEVTVQQAVQEAIRQAVPTIQYNYGNVYVYITINIPS
jgi:hypothetical protein